MQTQVSQQVAKLHSIVTMSRSASGGRPRRASSRRSSRMSEMASATLLRASSFVLPCPLAPGTSGQFATNHSPSRSIITVYWLAIASGYTRPVCPTVWGAEPPTARVAHGGRFLRRVVPPTLRAHATPRSRSAPTPLGVSCPEPRRSRSRCAQHPSRSPRSRAGMGRGCASLPSFSSSFSGSRRVFRIKTFRTFGDRSSPGRRMSSISSDARSSSGRRSQAGRTSVQR